VLAVLWICAAPASAGSLPDCLAHQHVCVSGHGRALISQGQEAQLQHEIGDDDIYLVVAASGKAGYTSAMDQIIGALNGHRRFTVGFLDTRPREFGAYSQGMLPAHGAQRIATAAVTQHRTDQNYFAALTEFVRGVQWEAGQQPDAAPGPAPSHALRTVAIVVGVILVLAVLGLFLIVRPARRRRQAELKDAKSAAQDDLIALSTEITNRDADAAIRGNPDAAAEQSAALTAYERGTAALDAASRPSDMGAVSRAIAEGQYRLACASALAAGQPRPARRPACFFDPRHGMSVRDVEWVPADGGPVRTVPACSACAHKVDQGIEPEIRKVEVAGTPVSYVNAGFAPAYWGGYGFLPGMFTGFLLGEALTPFAFGPAGYGLDDYGYGYGDGGYNDGDFGNGGGDFGNGGGDFGGGDFGNGGDFGGGDFGGGDFGGGDFGGGGGFS
jgi:uncharacterized membrane protein YgcG